MKLYVSHSSAYDFEAELYAPLRTAFGESHELWLPHDAGRVNGTTDAKTRIRSCDMMIAEVSLPSTGQGIEIGWADTANVPIVCVYKRGSRVSSALTHINARMVEYDGSDDLIENIREVIT